MSREARRNRRVMNKHSDDVCYGKNKMREVMRRSKRLDDLIRKINEPATIAELAAMMEEVKTLKAQMQQSIRSK